LKIKLKLFANLRQYLPGASIGEAVEVDIPEPFTLGELATMLKLPPDEVKICFVNGIICELDQKINAGDEVGIFPPIGGG